ncbi:hypothetical protein [Terrabacter sp. 2YAF2]|uniref:hypothetical protein n=1 Tax=Terrabacter sp. 2YAF2 TaxID=3233026 RepID=UPI003F98E864
MNRRRILVVCLSVVTALAACSGPGGTPGSSRTAHATTTPSSSTTAASPSASASSTPSSSATGSAAAPLARTAATLKKAALAVDDLPSGFSQDPSAGSGSGGPTVSSREPRCADLVSMMNLRNAPGSLASAEVAFSGGQNGPGIDESLDALGSSEKVAALQGRLKAALGGCPTVTMSLPGQGRSAMHVTVVNPPKFGTDPVAARVTAQGGPLDGFELTQVYTGVGDVVLALTFVGAAPADVDGATGLAHDKAATVLGVSPGARTS